MSTTNGRDSELTTRGGAQGMAANHADMRAYADVLDRIGSDLAGIAGRATAIGLEPDVLTSAPFATRAFAQVQGSLAQATAGSNGLLALALRLEGRALLLRTKADLIEAADSFGSFAKDGVTAGAAFTIGALTVPVAIGTGGLLYGKALAEERANSLSGWLSGGLSNVEFARSLLHDLGDAKDEAVSDVQRRLPTITDVHRFLLDHPGVTDRVVVGLPHFVNGLPGAGGGLVPDDYEGVVSLLIALGHLRGDFYDSPVTPRKVEGGPRLRPNLSLTDLVELSNLNHEDVVGDPDKSGVRIVTVTQAGVTRYVVQLPGTQEWPTVSGRDPSDLTTNLELSDDGHAEIMTAVLTAMEQAKIPADAEVMLMGHSQGGILAAALAADERATRRFNVTGVLTYGSPVGRITIPEGIKMLSVEHLQDPVPRTDGTDNPDTADRTTVYREPSISELETLTPTKPLEVTDAHNAEIYRDTFQQIETAAANGDDRLTAVVADLGGFFGSEAVTTYEDWDLVREGNP